MQNSIVVYLGAGGLHLVKGKLVNSKARQGSGCDIYGKMLRCKGESVARRKKKVIFFYKIPSSLDVIDRKNTTNYSFSSYGILSQFPFVFPEIQGSSLHYPSLAYPLLSHLPSFITGVIGTYFTITKVAYINS